MLCWVDELVASHLSNGRRRRRGGEQELSDGLGVQREMLQLVHAPVPLAKRQAVRQETDEYS